MNVSSEKFVGPQFDPELRVDHWIFLAKNPNTRPIIPIKNYGIEYLDETNKDFGWTLGLDVAPIASSEDNSVPQSGVVSFADMLGVPNNRLMTIYPFEHTNKVITIDSLEDTVYIADEGRLVPYNADEEDPFFDGLIVLETEQTKDMVLSLTGADCTPVVIKAVRNNGQCVMCGIHAGRKGALSGVVENTILEFAKLGIDPKTVQVLVGAGAQALETPPQFLANESLLNPNTAMRDVMGSSWVEMLGKAVTVGLYNKYPPESDQEDDPKAVYNNQLDTILRLQLALSMHGILPTKGINVVCADTLLDDRLKSHRLKTIAHNVGDKTTEVLNSGRNMTFVRFN